MTTTVFSPDFTNATKPTDTTNIIFGVNNSSHTDYLIPVMKFDFHDAKGGDENSYPSVYIRMTSSFDTNLSNPYAEQEGIFGKPATGPATGVGDLTEILSAGAKSGIEALRKQILAGAGAAGGFIASAGSSGISQVEFLTREFFNNFQQLIYRGPQFRRFSPSFAMRPTSLEEAKAMKQIIAVFRAASSPSAGTLTHKELPKGSVPEGETDSSFSETAITTLRGDTKLTFGYPNTCKIELLMVKGSVPLSSSVDIKPIFQSKLCVIESVNVTYGSQNKMTFFTPIDDAAKNNIYYPTDVNLQLQLRELVLLTESDALSDYDSNNLTIL